MTGDILDSSVTGSCFCNVSLPELKNAIWHFNWLIHDQWATQLISMLMQVKSETVCKCYHKAGILDEDLNVTPHFAQQENGDNLFQEMDNEFQLSDLISQVMPTLITKYTEGDTSLPVSQFLLAACSSEAANNNVHDENDDDDVIEVEEVDPMLK